MEGRDDGHAQFTQEREDVTARAPAEDAVFVLQGHEIYIVGMQEVGSAEIRVNILLCQLKPDAGWIGITGLDVIDGQGDARRFAVFCGDGFTQIGSKCRNAALPWYVVADKRDAIYR